MSEYNQYLNQWFYQPGQADKSDEQLAEELFNSSALHFPDPQGKTLLHYIATVFFDFRNELRLALITLLFKYKADANAIDQYGRTALHDLVEKWQDTPWSFAEKFEPIAELFFQNNAKFTLQDENKKTPLDVLLENPNRSPFVAKVLIKFMVLEQPCLTQPHSLNDKKHKNLSEYWSLLGLTH